MTQTFMVNLNEEFNANRNTLSSMKKKKRCVCKKESPDSLRRRALLEQWQLKKAGHSKKNKSPAVKKLHRPTRTVSPFLTNDSPRSRDSSNIEAPTFSSIGKIRNMRVSRSPMYYGSSCKICARLSPRCSFSPNETSKKPVQNGSPLFLTTGKIKQDVQKAKHENGDEIRSHAFNIQNPCLLEDTLPNDARVVSPVSASMNGNGGASHQGPSTLVKAAKSVLETANDMAERRKNVKFPNNDVVHIIPHRNKNFSVQSAQTVPTNDLNQESSEIKNGQLNKNLVSPTCEISKQSKISFNGSENEIRKKYLVEKENKRNEKPKLDVVSQPSLEDTVGTNINVPKDSLIQSSCHVPNSQNFVEQIKESNENNVRPEILTKNNIQPKTLSPVEKANSRMKKMSIMMAKKREVFNTLKEKYSKEKGNKTVGENTNKAKDFKSTGNQAASSSQKEMTENKIILNSSMQNSSENCHSESKKDLKYFSASNSHNATRDEEDEVSKQSSPIDVANKRLMQMNTMISKKQDALNAQKKMHDNQFNHKTKADLIPGICTGEAKYEENNRSSFQNEFLTDMNENKLFLNGNIIRNEKHEKGKEINRNPQALKKIHEVIVEDVSDTERDNCDNVMHSDKNSEVNRSQDLKVEACLSTDIFLEIYHGAQRMIMELKQKASTLLTSEDPKSLALVCSIDKLIEAIESELATLIHKTLFSTASYQENKKVMMGNSSQSILSPFHAPAKETHFCKSFLHARKPISEHWINQFSPEKVKSSPSMRHSQGSFNTLAEEYAKSATSSNGVDTPMDRTQRSDIATSGTKNLLDDSKCPPVSQSIGTNFVVELCGHLNLDMGQRTVLSGIMDRQWG